MSIRFVLTSQESMRRSFDVVSAENTVAKLVIVLKPASFIKLESLSVAMQEHVDEAWLMPLLQEALLDQLKELVA